MRTAVFLAVVFALFVSSTYVVLAKLHLSTGLASLIVTVVTVGPIVAWMLWDSGLLRPSTESEKRWDADVRANRYRAQESERLAAEIKKKLRAEIRKNPALDGFRNQVESGAILSIEDLAYRSNPAIRVTCPHLRPIENKLREAGCAMRLLHAWNLTPIPGTISAAAVLEKFPEPLEYKEEEFYDERTPTFYQASLACPQCNSIIYCTHPVEAGPTAIRWKNL